jgi:hypothetical protein
VNEAEDRAGAAGRRPTGAMPDTVVADGTVVADTGDPHANVGAYVVDALDAPARAEFRAHLDSCENCRREVVEFRETAAELSLLVSARPPDALRSATLDGIRGVRPLPPEPPEPRIRHVPPAPPEELAPLDEHPSIMPWSLELGARSEVPAPAPVQRINRTLVALAAAVVIIALGLGGWMGITAAQRSAEVAAARADAAQQSALLSAPDAQILRTTLGGAPVSVVLSRQQDRGLLVAESLPAPAAGRVYQVWTLDGSSVAAAAVVPNGGAVRVWLSGPLADADELAITAEPAPDGSARPTTDPLATVRV